jgi:hypothetical protein
MTQEGKFLLLKDLNARLPYGVYVEHTTTKIRGKLKGMMFEHIYNDTDSIQDINAWAMFFGDEYVDATYFRPILRPMSSMTEEERKEYKHLVAFSGSPDGATNFTDWLNANHFDYRGLIEKGLAIEVTEKNNPYK